MNQSTVFNKGATTFLMGIDNASQLDLWLKSHPQIRGLAFLGRSNVGKSSLINTLFGSKTARTSKTPGRTRQINIFSVKLIDHDETEFYLFDVPGYGYADISKEMSRNWELLMEVFFLNVSPNVLMVNIQDARHPYEKSDQAFYQYYKQFQLTTTLVFNKMDKLKTQKERHALKTKMPALFKVFKWVKSFHIVSAEKKDGIKELEENLKIHLLLNSISAP